MIDIGAPLDLGDPGAGAFLDGIQGNVLRAHAREHAAHLLIRFGKQAGEARKWVGEFARKYVTSAGEQTRQTERFRKTRDGGTFAALALSATGYAALEITAAPADKVFQKGLKQSDVLQATDPPPSTWETPYQGELHALAVIADQNADRLKLLIQQIQTSLAPIAALVQLECGDRLTRHDPRAGDLTLVHFGFADGISQPLAIKQDIDDEIAKRGATRWDPGAPLKLLLAADPSGGYGSYFVFRKLEQDVAGFLAAEAQLVVKLGLAADPKQVEPLIVGRYRDGYPPFTVKAEPDGSAGNDFNFDDDRFGAGCPYHAHIRKTNPRGDLASPGPGRPSVPLATEKSQRIARRGMPYGSGAYLTGAAPPPKGGVGLYFMSAQGDLQNFELQQGGCDSNDFAPVGVGVDATIGHLANPVPQTFLTPLKGATAKEAFVRMTFANFVTLRGGEYFFLPSMGFFQTLSV
jgi:deferrochelatase/peroxidase EfeB